jgi:hypothetical protein
MHRSGTSATAAMCQAAGLFIGDRLVEALPSNPEGHFEDVDFHLLTRAIIADNGFPDNGFVSDVPIEVSARREKGLEALLVKRRARGIPWGWKDPRSVLLLDVLLQALPEAMFLFVFRAPWQVMDSLYRRGDAACLDDPMLALRVWVHYNRLILSFARTHPARSMVLDFAQLAREPGRCMVQVGQRMGVALGAAGVTFRPELASFGADEARVALLNALRPECLHIYRDLCELSGSDSAKGVRPTEQALMRVLEGCVGQWAASAAPSEEHVVQ